MKFRFCGDQDCPDWFLTQIASLSRLSSIKAKMLAQHVARHLAGQEINLEKVAALVGDCKLPDGDMQALLAAVDFVLQSASRFSTEEDHLRAELQQIGLPREHATALAKVHTDFTKDIRQRLIGQSLMINKLEDVTWKMAKEDAEPLINLNLRLDCVTKKTTAQFQVDAHKLRTLLFELERIKTMMTKHGMNNADLPHDAKQ